MSDLTNQIIVLSESSKNGEVVHLGLSKEEMRGRILAMQTQMQKAQDSGEIEKCDLNEVFPLRHIFAPGAYAREMTLPAGHWIIGKIHKHAHLNFISKGRVAVLTEEGVMFMSAPYTFVSSVGTKRFVLVLEDTIWTTVHITDKTDLEEIEQEVIAKTYDEVPSLEHQKVKEIL
jgi:hypothetical protein